MPRYKDLQHICTKLRAVPQSERIEVSIDLKSLLTFHKHDYYQALAAYHPAPF